MNPKLGLKTPDWLKYAVTWRRTFYDLLTKEEKKVVEKVATVIEVVDMGTTAGEHQTGPVFHTIRLSPYLNMKEAYETYGHELAHLCDALVFGKHGHSKSWKLFMCRFGLAPEKCHTIPINVRKKAADILLKIDQYKGK